MLKKDVEVGRRYKVRLHGNYTISEIGTSADCPLAIVGSLEVPMAISASSQKRIDAFVDCFIRSRFVESLTEERDSDFINESERASRVADAAEEGCDGKTHAEVIQDWRNAFSYWLRGRRSFNSYDRFEAAVSAHFDAVEEWHEKNGSLWQEIG